MNYISKLTDIGIGAEQLPNRKNRSLVYIEGNKATVIGTVTNEELFTKAVEEILYHQFDDRTEDGT
jgi:predicted transcriptional regulator